MKHSIVLMLLAILLPGCGGSSGSDGPNSGLDVSRIVPACFVASPSNPLLTTNSEFMGSNWNDPSVLKVGDTYIMYASADTNFAQDIKIYRLTSSDGENFSLNPATAVFEKSTGMTDWDRKSTETPSVAYFNGEYHLFYTGYPLTLGDPYAYKIGHATSPDGITWTRDASYLLAPTDPLNPVPNLDFNQYIVAEPGAVVFNNRLYVYFTAVGADAMLATAVQTIGMIYTDDGVSWSTPVKVLSPNQTLYPRMSYSGYSTPSAAVINNAVHLFYDVAEDPFVQTKLHHAVSADGATNFIEDSQALFDRTDFAITTDEINGPAPLLDGSTLRLYFAGHTGLDLGIGLASCNIAAN